MYKLFAFASQPRVLALLCIGLILQGKLFVALANWTRGVGQQASWRLHTLARMDAQHQLASRVRRGAPTPRHAVWRLQARIRRKLLLLSLIHI